MNSMFSVIITYTHTQIWILTDFHCLTYKLYPDLVVVYTGSYQYTISVERLLFSTQFIYDIGRVLTEGIQFSVP
jgi:hypothetical protein